MPSQTIDIHVHPGLKPYGHSFALEPVGQNSNDPTQEHSIWHKDHPNDLERWLERTLGLVKFTQSDMHSLTDGKVHIICASLYSIERGLMRLKTGTGNFTDLLNNFVSGLGKKRINFLQQHNDYFSDLTGEYRFYESLHNKTLLVAGKGRKYILVKDYGELQLALEESRRNAHIEHVIVIITIEGMHNLDSDIDGSTPDQATLIQHVQEIKSWPYPPLFVTFAHHFYNKLCGHAASLISFPQNILTDQKPGMDEGINSIGMSIIETLLDTAGGQRRILIDVKHMNIRSRYAYYKYLDQIDSTRTIPIIISHGACNGFMHPKTATSTESIDPELKATGKHMYDRDINFYDDEIIVVAQRKGLIGLQLDERRIASKTYKLLTRCRTLFAKKLTRQLANSRMVWNNIEHIATLLDKNNLPAWDCICLGSDYDGLIDSVNLFWSAQDMPALQYCIRQKAQEWLEGSSYQFKLSTNNISADEIVDKIFYHNALRFFEKNFSVKPVI